MVAAGFVVAAVLLVGVVVVVARPLSAPPSRCADGMVVVGARCCGEGQTLVRGRCTGKPSRCAVGLEVTEAGCLARPRAIGIPEGVLRIGPSDWEAQGQVEPREVHVAAFAIDAYEVTESRWERCVADSACEIIVLSGEPGRPVTRVSLVEAMQFCSWAGGFIPSADELAFAAAGTKGRRYPWGDTGAVCRRAAWGLVRGPCGESADGPEVAGSHPDGATTTGAHDLAGNVAEWATPMDNGKTLLDLAEARGGSFADAAASALRSWNRREIEATTRSTEIGLRCVYPFSASHSGGALPR